MKTTLLLAAATVVNTASAVEPLHSPKGKARTDMRWKAPTSTTDMIAGAVLPGSPKDCELADSLRKVSKTGPSVDLAHGQRPMISPKDPRYGMALRELHAREFQLAPLKRAGGEISFR